MSGSDPQSSSLGLSLCLCPKRTKIVIQVADIKYGLSCISLSRVAICIFICYICALFFEETVVTDLMHNLDQ